MRRLGCVMIVIALTLCGSVSGPAALSYAAAKQLHLDTSGFATRQGESYQFGVENYSMSEVDWDISPLTPPTDQATKIMPDGQLTIGSSERRQFIFVRGWLKSDIFNVDVAEVLICPSTWSWDDGDWPSCWGQESKVFATLYTPTISGTLKVGKTLVAKVKSWSPKPTMITYEWRRDGEVIEGATKSTYKLNATDKSTKLTVTVTGTKSGYTTMSRTSKVTSSVKAGTIKKGSVKIGGTTKVGGTLKAKTSGWTGGVSYSYQWYRSGKKISGATNSSYQLVKKDKGKKLKVKVIAKKDGYSNTSKASKYTSKVRK